MARRAARAKLDPYLIPQIVLIGLACFDFLRGFMHTFAIHWAAENIAQLNLSLNGDDQLWLLGTFGISNFLSGALLLLIALKAKRLAPYALLIIPATYLLGAIAFRSADLSHDAAFNGFYIMVGYLSLCIVTFGIFLIQKRRAAQK